MASINKVILIGNLGRDPEVRYTPSGAAVCNVSVATTRNWKDKNSGDKVEETEWHRVVFYDRLAEIAGEYLKKGRPVYVEGRLKTRKWQDKDGKDNYTTEIVAEQMQLLGGREGGGGGREQRLQPRLHRDPRHGAALRGDDRVLQSARRHRAGLAQPAAEVRMSMTAANPNEFCHRGAKSTESEPRDFMLRDGNSMHPCSVRSAPLGQKLQRAGRAGAAQSGMLSTQDCLPRGRWEASL